MGRGAGDGGGGGQVEKETFYKEGKICAKTLSWDGKGEVLEAKAQSDSFVFSDEKDLEMNLRVVGRILTADKTC